MRKVLNVLLLAFMSVVIFTSCESKDPEGRLSGKTYECEFQQKSPIFWGYTKVYKFYSNGDVYYECDGYRETYFGLDHDYLDIEIERDFLKYEVVGDKVIVFWDNENKDEFARGVIKGNTIEIEQILEEGEIDIEVFTLR